MPHRSGVIGTRRGLLMSAADSMRITLHGRGGHASMPHRLVDPVIMAASTVMRLQTIVSREVDP
jgi:metal-dependent amidase/aminoacylase/carboxypeptidase family protein